MDIFKSLVVILVWSALFIASKAIGFGTFFSFIIATVGIYLWAKDVEDSCKARQLLHARQQLRKSKEQEDNSEERF